MSASSAGVPPQPLGAPFKAEPITAGGEIGLPGGRRPGANSSGGGLGLTTAAGSAVWFPGLTSSLASAARAWPALWGRRGVSLQAWARLPGRGLGAGAAGGAVASTVRRARPARRPPRGRRAPFRKIASPASARPPARPASRHAGRGLDADRVLDEHIGEPGQHHRGHQRAGADARHRHAAGGCRKDRIGQCHR